jgi:hypothetical protein
MSSGRSWGRSTPWPPPLRLAETNALQFVYVAKFAIKPTRFGMDFATISQVSEYEIQTASF